MAQASWLRYLMVAVCSCLGTLAILALTGRPMPWSERDRAGSSEPAAAEPSVQPRVADEKRPAHEEYEAVHRAVAEQERDRTTSFAEVVEARFAAWSRGQGAVSVNRINELLWDKAVKGDEAAALAAIHRTIDARQENAKRKKKELVIVSLSQQDFLGREWLHYEEGLFREYRSYLACIRRELFADPQVPTLQGVAQGHLGDCYLMSTIGALVTTHPADIRKMIQTRPDGSYDITFLDGHKFHVPEVTDGMIVLGARAGNQGLWLNVLETAYGYHRLEKRVPESELDEAALGRTDLELPEATLNGGWAGSVMKLFTGRQAYSFAIPRNQVSSPAMIAKVRSLVAEAVKTKSLMCLKSLPRSAPKICGHHVYAVIGFDERTDRVKIWNPWGAHLNFQPKGPPGFKNGYPTRSGEFEVPIAELGRCFWRLDHDRVGKVRGS